MCTHMLFSMYFWEPFLPIFACRGGPGSAAPRGGGPRGTQKLIFFYARTDHYENIFEAFSLPARTFTKIFSKRKPRENLAKTSRKPRENLALTNTLHPRIDPKVDQKVYRRPFGYKSVRRVQNINAHIDKLPINRFRGR